MRIMYSDLNKNSNFDAFHLTVKIINGRSKNLISSENCEQKFLCICIIALRNQMI